MRSTVWSGATRREHHITKPKKTEVTAAEAERAKGGNGPAPKAKALPTPRQIEEGEAQVIGGGEPLLGAVHFDFDWFSPNWLRKLDALMGEKRQRTLDRVIAGGESQGPPERALVERERTEVAYDRMTGSRYGYRWRPKPEALEWVRDIIRQCQEARVPVFFKQWPIPPHRPGGRAEIDDRELEARYPPSPYVEQARMPI